jgi:hypothetical protein
MPKLAPSGEASLQKLSSMSLNLTAMPQTGKIPLLAAVYALGLFLFLAIEPTKSWLLILLSGLVALGADGIVRSHPRSLFREPIDTAPHLLVPTLVALAGGFFLEDTIVGYWSLLAAIITGGLMGIVLYAEYVSVDTESQSYIGARFTLSLFAYLAAFALYAVFYSYDLDLVAASFCVGLVSAVLGAEILRDPSLMPFPIVKASIRAIAFSFAIGLVVAEARWALYFTPLDGFLAAVFLLLVFYVASGLIQHHLTASLSWPVALEFALVALAGLAMVILGGVFTEA